MKMNPTDSKLFFFILVCLIESNMLIDELFEIISLEILYPL